MMAAVGQHPVLISIWFQSIPHHNRHRSPTRHEIIDTSAAMTITIHHLTTSQSERVVWLCEEPGRFVKIGESAGMSDCAD